MHNTPPLMALDAANETAKINHADMVRGLVKPGDVIASELTNAQLQVLECAVLLSIEAGRLLDAIKKHVIYRKPLDAPVERSCLDRANCATSNVTRAVRVMESNPDLAHNYKPFTGDKAHLLHMAIGISGESAELLEAVYVHAFQDSPLDRINVKEELGDLAFYDEGIRQAVGMTREECLDANIEKLGKRYRNLQYSDKGAVERADKEGNQ